MGVYHKISNFLTTLVIPAKAGIFDDVDKDSRFRGNDISFVMDPRFRGDDILNI
jgi:hypothetical protein